MISLILRYNDMSISIQNAYSYVCSPSKDYFILDLNYDVTRIDVTSNGKISRNVDFKTLGHCKIMNYAKLKFETPKKLLIF